MKTGNLISEEHTLNIIGIQCTKAKGIPLTSISQLSGKTRGTVTVGIKKVTYNHYLPGIVVPQRIFGNVHKHFWFSQLGKGGATGI